MKTKKYFNLSGATYKVIFLLMLIVILIRPISAVYSLRDTYFERGYAKEYENYRSLYYSSQYVKKKNPSIIPDEVFESFAGGAFLKGLNPILIVHDHPPMGRYIVSFSILLFNNSKTIILALLTIAAVGIFLIARLMIGNVLLSLIPLGVFINEPLFLNKIIFSPLPEAIHLPFIVMSLYFFMKSINSKKYLWWFLATSLMLGFVISIRFFVLGGVLVTAMCGFLILRQRSIKRILTFLLTLPIAILVLFLSYTRTMMLGYSPIEVLGIQKYILAYHKSKFILPFSYWDLLLFNRWHTWWGNRAVITDSNWFISWPISVCITVFGTAQALFKRIKISDYELMLLLWVGFYSLLLSAGYTSTRYFLPVIPFFYILATSFFIRFVKKYILR